MIDLKTCITKSAFCVSMVWLIYTFTASMILTGGKFWLSGGGATMLSYVPASFFAFIIYRLEKYESKYSWMSGSIFWICLFSSILIFTTVVVDMEHWPYGLAFIFLCFTLVSTLQAVAFSILLKKELESQALTIS
jgi:hypothetical protein